MAGPFGQQIFDRNTISGMNPYDCFMWMFPNTYLGKIVEITSHELEQKVRRRTTGGEILRFFGIIILMTRMKFSSRRSLWSRDRISKYVPSPELGKVMNRQRFEDLVQCVTFSHASERGTPYNNRWTLVNGFLDAINDHMLAQFTPSHMICVDESMSRWYGLGGEWSQVGLPHYVSIDRKPENGCEIKSAACGKSGILIRLELVMSAEDTSERDYEKETSHGTAVTLRLVEPWFDTERIVCGDSFFASAATARALYMRGMRFIGVVKLATKEYPKKYLSEVEKSQRGDHVSLISSDANGFKYNKCRHSIRT